MAVLLSNSDEPVHRQVAQQVKLLIARNCRPGDVLPTYRALAQRLGVGLRSVSEAMSLLAEQGIVNPVRRRGTVVLRQVRPDEARLTQVGLVLGRPMHTIFKGGYMGQIMIGLSHAISDCHADLRIFPYVPERGVVLPGEVARTGVEGVVLHCVFDDDFLATYAEMEIPAVVIDHRPEGVPLDCLACDNAGAAHAVVDHLASLGHRRIAYVQAYSESPAVDGRSEKGSVESDPAERRQAIRDATARAGMGLRRPLITSASERDDGRARFEAEVLAVLAAPERPTAFVTDGEESALGLIALLRHRGVSVPEGVSVAAIASAARLDFEPQPVTSCVMNFHGMGLKAVETLALRARTPRPAAGEVMRIGFRLCPGATAAAPPDPSRSAPRDHTP